MTLFGRRALVSGLLVLLVMSSVDGQVLSKSSSLIVSREWMLRSSLGGSMPASKDRALSASTSAVMWIYELCCPHRSLIR